MEDKKEENMNVLESLSQTIGLIKEMELVKGISKSIKNDNPKGYEELKSSFKKIIPIVENSKLSKIDLEGISNISNIEMIELVLGAIALNLEE